MSVEQSALVVAVPAADPIVGSFRLDLDPAAALGVPAHITTLYPFMPPTAIDETVLDDLERLFSSMPAFGITLGSVSWFGDQVVYLEPDPDHDLRRLTALVVERWPEWQPYGGLHPDPTPHLTVGDGAEIGAMRTAAEAVAGSLPIRVDVTEIQLLAGTNEPGSWHHMRSFPLSPAH